MSDIAVIVTCHEPYLKWLPEALESINRQSPEPVERIVVLDRCSSPSIDDGRWRLIEGDWGHPSGARNSGLTATEAPWLLFWDADNVMAEGYMAAMQEAISTASSDLGIIYPDIQYCDDRLAPQWYWQLPEWDYWGLRAGNCVDTASAWRRLAIDIAGGWPKRSFALLDYALALDITALGWQATRLKGPPILKRVHAGSRSEEQRRNEETLTDYWRARSLAIVSLLAGRDETFEDWSNFLLAAELPPKTALYVVDNSGRPDFTQMAFETCQQIADMRGFLQVNFVATGQAFQAPGSEPYFHKDRHLHIARLYSSVFPRVREDLVLTLEDDVEPPLDAARRLGEEIGHRTRANIGVVAAAYRMPSNQNEACAGGLAGTGWGSPVWWEHLPHEPLEVRSVGGGCTLWANWALHDIPVHIRGDKLLGWDGVFCAELRRRGYCVQLHGGVRCQHHIHGRRTKPEAATGKKNSPKAGATAIALPDKVTRPPVGVSQLSQELVNKWHASLGGDTAAQARWRMAEGGKWSWGSNGVAVAGGDTEWVAFGWESCGPSTLTGLENFVVEVTISGKADAAGLSFGPYKDFLARLDNDSGARRLQLEVDMAGGCWVFRVDGQLRERRWWDSAVHSVDDLANGMLTFKAKGVQHVLFQDLVIRSFSSSCQLSIIITCYRFLQRLRISLRNWCHQEMPLGAYEVLVVNPNSPDGTHEYLAAVARSYPHVRLREVSVGSEMATNKGAMINHAFRLSRGEWIWLTDADCLFSPTSAATAITQLGGRKTRVFFGQRRHLTVSQTDALLTARLDGLTEFEKLCQHNPHRPPDSAPWGYTQIVHRSTLERVPYRESVDSFAHSDDLFVEDCKRLGIPPEQIEGVFCLHMDHPFAWHGTDVFL